MGIDNTEEVLIQILDAIKELKKSVDRLSAVPSHQIVEQALRENPEIATRAVVESLRQSSNESRRLRSDIPDSGRVGIVRNQMNAR